jgi:diguanylate cyclase (GGDEF)-like protein
MMLGFSSERSELHIPTLSLAVVLVSATLALVVGLVAEKGQRDGMYLWAAGLWAHTLAYSLFGLRGLVDDSLSVVLGNTLLSVSLALLSESLCEFHACKPRRLMLWSPVVVAFLAFGLLVHSLPARMIIGPLIFSAQIVMMLLIQARARARTVGRGKHFVCIAMAALLPLLLARLVASLQRDDALADFGAPSLVLALTFMLALASALLATLGFVLMSKERADHHTRQMAMFDELTGLASRRSTLQALAQQVAAARRSGQPLTVLMLDIDHFKEVNDEYGHQAGDTALKHVAQTFRSRFRRQDLLGRFGGEEFLAVLPATAAAEGGLSLAETVRAAVAGAPVPGVGEGGLPLTVSIGVAEIAPHAAGDTEAVVRAADLAMYRAKVAGRNRVELARAQDYGNGVAQRMRMPGTAPAQGSST